MRYPTTPDLTINEGDRVRSFDFPGVAEAYVEGTVVNLEWHEGCNRYKIRVERRVWEGVEHIIPHPHDYVYPPVNGTATSFGGVCRGVQRIEE